MPITVAIIVSKVRSTAEIGNIIMKSCGVRGKFAI
jgi:hypothetical protein